MIADGRLLEIAQAHCICETCEPALRGEVRPMAEELLRLRELTVDADSAVLALEDQCRQLRERLEMARACGQAVVPDDPRWDKVFADLTPIDKTEDWATERARNQLRNPERK